MCETFKPLQTMIFRIILFLSQFNNYYLALDNSTTSNYNSTKSGGGLPIECKYKMSPGPCINEFVRFYYDMRDYSCKVFFFSGCGGNPNRFLTRADCYKKCNPYYYTRFLSQNINQSDLNPNENNDTIHQSYIEGGVQDATVLERVLVGIPVLAGIVGQVCYRDIGCFGGFRFNVFKDGFNYLPYSPDGIDPKFILSNKNNTSMSRILRYNPTEAQLVRTNFNPRFRTIIITHGYSGDLESWMLRMRELIYEQPFHDYNVILMTWGNGAYGEYFQAVANIQVVGALVAFFINRLCQIFEIKNNMFELVGHSLGAQVMGYAGKKLFNPKVARITGLDPAGPGFRKHTFRLDKDAATQVITVHTDTNGFALIEGLGNEEALGHINFYPNGGKFQPGCPASSGVFNALNRIIRRNITFGCSHRRAYNLTIYLGKPGQDCQPVGYKCDDWQTFSEGRCADCGDDNRKCHLMGLYLDYYKEIKLTKDSNETDGKRYYLTTDSLPDYCCEQCHLTMFKQ